MIKRKARPSLNRASLVELLEPRQLMSATVWQSSGASDENYAPIWPPERSEVRDLIVNLPDSTTLTDSMLSLGLANGDGSGANDGSANTDISSTVLGTPVLQSGYKWRVPITASTTYSDATGSLKNGIYHLTVTDGSDVTGAGFWRLQGDLNGDGVVNSSDTTIFNNDITYYSASADFNLDSAVNASDNLQYTHHDLGTSWSFPTVSTAATTSSLTDTTVTLSTAGAVGAGYSSSQLTYQWELASGPSGAPAPTFSANNSNAASTTVATVYQAGDYTFKAVIWDPALLDLPTPPVNSTAPYVTFNQTPSTLTITGGSAFATTLGAGQNYWLDAAIDDQFGNYIVETGDPIHWTANAGTNATGGTFNIYNTADGTDVIEYHAPGTLGTFNIDGTISSTGTITSNTLNGTVVPPTVATVAAATLSDLVKGSAPYVTLNTLGADPAGESTLTYTWTVTGESTYEAFDAAVEPNAVYYETTPIAYITGSVGMDTGPYNNGLNSAKSIYATMNTCGRWTFTCTITDAGGNTATTAVDVNVAQKLTTVNLTNDFPSSGTLSSVFGTGYVFDVDVLNYVAQETRTGLTRRSAAYPLSPISLG